MKKSIYYLALFSGLAFVSCNNEDNDGSNLPSSDNELLRTSGTIDYVNESDFQLSTETASDNASMRTTDAATTFLETCATVNIETAPGGNFPKTFTLDFGAGCTNSGITRSGILAFTLTGPLLTSGSQLTMSRSNYYVNGYKVEGDVVFVNQTTNPNVPEWTRTITNGQITTPAGIVYAHSGTRVVRQTAGLSTLVLIDNIYEVASGTHTVTREGGNSLTATVEQPLIKKAACANISQGILNLQGTYLDGDLDYGDNSCDNTAIYTHFDGQTYTVVLW